MSQWTEHERIIKEHIEQWLSHSRKADSSSNSPVVVALNDALLNIAEAGAAEKERAYMDGG